MKRKLNENDVPDESHKPTHNDWATFDSFGLDARILQGIAGEEFTIPTAVQAKAIPLALEGMDILARSKTGSGKTAAYVIPILQSILKKKSHNRGAKSISALILVPTRELSGQITKVIESLAKFCGKDIRVENIARKEDERVQRARISDLPDILVGTPGRVCVNLNSSVLALTNLAHLVIDEADLVLSYGYDDDLRNIAQSVPKDVQTYLMSATFRADVDTLKELFCRNPVILELDEEEKQVTEVSQYMVKCAEDEKFLLAYAIFKLKLIKGKCIIFVDDVDRCYRLKLFLEQFGIRSCVLNSELPANSRIHVVDEFNKNVYDIIIATDEHEILGDEDNAEELPENDKLGVNDETKADTDKGEADSIILAQSKLSTNGDDETRGGEDQTPQESSGAHKHKKRRISKKDKEYGIARGIDFKNVACVLNFDLPTTSRSYTHRIGRTARAGKTGMALSFVVPQDLYRKHKPTSIASCKHDETVLAKIMAQQEKAGRRVEPYQFDMTKLTGFRYRLADALRAVTRLAVREARTRELRQELIKSEKLKRHFEENPADLYHLRHDGELRAARVQSHLKHVPDYLLPGGAKQALQQPGPGFVGFMKMGENRIRKARAQNKARGKGSSRPSKARKVNPLKTFNAKGRR